MDEPIRLFTRAAAVVVQADHVLVHETTTPGDAEPHHALPGGPVEPRETATEALARAIFDEFGVHIAVHDLLYVAEGFFTRAGRRHHEIGLYFAVHVSQTAEVSSREPNLRPRWVPLDGGLGRLLPAWLREELPRRAREGWNGGARYLTSFD